MLRQWRASIIQKAVKDSRRQRRQVQFRENNSLLIPNLASVVLHRSSSWNCRLHRPNRSSSRFDATGYASRTHTTFSAKSEPTLSDAQRRTIYALSTPPGKAGIAIIRVSGPDALDVWRRVTRKKKVWGYTDTTDTPAQTRHRPRDRRETR